jgi:F0F1-type ATP synthase assembly protein I
MQQRGWLDALRFLGFGWLVVVAVLIGLFLGLWLDQRVHTTPLFTILGVILGVAAAARTTYRMIKEMRPTSQSSGQRARSRRGRR